MTSDRRTAACLFAAVACLYLFTAPYQSILVGDGGTMLLDAGRIVEHGFGPTVAADARPLSKYGLGQVLLDVPFVRLKTGAFTARSIYGHYFRLLGFCVLPCTLGSLCSVLVFLLCRQLGYGRGTALAVAGALAVGTMVWPYSRTVFADPTVGLCWLLSLYGIGGYRHGGGLKCLALAGAAIGYAVLTKVAAVPAAIVILAFALWSVRRRGEAAPGDQVRAVAALLVPITAIAAVFLWYSDLRFGSPWRLGYGADRDRAFGFNTPLLTGLFGLLLSPGKGLLWYNPALLLAAVGARRFWKRRRAEAVTVVAVAAVTILLHAKWWAWHGDWSWGPRFLVGTLPLLMLMSAPVFEAVLTKQEGRGRWRAPAIAVLLAVAMAVQIPGLLVSPYAYLRLQTQRLDVFMHGRYTGADSPIRDDSVHTHFIPEFSPLVGHIWLIRCTAAKGTPAFAARVARPPWFGLNPRWAPPRAEDIADLFTWDVWWLHARADARDRGQSPWPFTLVAAAILLAAVAAAAAVVRTCTKT